MSPINFRMSTHVKIKNVIVAAVALFFTSQLAYGEYTKLNGPFLYFKEKHGTNEFKAMNNIIDEYFSESRSIDESMKFMYNAKFKCKYIKNYEIGVRVNTKHSQILDISQKIAGQVNCNYEFGGWLPYPNVWIVAINIGADSKSTGVLKQRMAN